MKRGTPDHPKTLMLASRLGIPKYAAVGILESLWHFTARYAPQGDIGKFADGVIEDNIGWCRDTVATSPDTVATSPDMSRLVATPDELTAGDLVSDDVSRHVATKSALIRALVWERWVDPHPTQRLVVHDWSDHSDEAADLFLFRHGLCYADGNPPRRGQKAETCRDKSRHVPTLIPIPIPKPIPSRDVATQSRQVREGGSGLGLDGDEAHQILVECPQLRNFTWEADVRARRSWPAPDGSIDYCQLAREAVTLAENEAGGVKNPYSFWMKRCQMAFEKLQKAAAAATPRARSNRFTGEFAS